MRAGGFRSNRSPFSSVVSVCSTMTTASAPRGTIPPVAISAAVPGTTAQKRLLPRGQDFGDQGQSAGHPLAGANGVVGADREAVDTGAVEAGDIDIGDDPARQDPAKRCESGDVRARVGADRDDGESGRSASSRSTTSRNCSCRARLRRVVEISFIRARSAPMSALVIKICRHRRSVRIPLARLGNDDKAVGADGGHQPALGEGGDRLDLSVGATGAPGRSRSTTDRRDDLAGGRHGAAR